jgi:hypothetical protein
MTIGEALRLRAEVAGELRRIAHGGAPSSEWSRKGAARLLLELDSRLGSTEDRIASASKFLYGEREARKRGLA